MTAGLLTIGRFARLTRLSVKQLRRYDELGLLAPAFVDADTGVPLLLATAGSADAVRARAGTMNAPIELELRDEPWGQRHFITRDLDGLLVDVVEPIAPNEECAALYLDSDRATAT